MINKEKYDHSIEVLRLGSHISEEYYNDPLIISYSGGKDSDVLLQLAIESGIKFEVQNSHTTVDAPQTVYHIREVFKSLEEKGIPCVVHHARDKGGKLITMWSLIEHNKFPPTRIARYCCDYLKEQSTPNRIIAVGVREAESVKRQGRSDFATRERNHPERVVYRDLKTATRVFEDAESRDDDTWDCRMVKRAKQQRDLICNPIYYWSDDDVWDFIKDRGIKTNPLYDMGFERVGCIGCPLAPRRTREWEFRLFPAYKINYIKAFDKIDKSGYKGDFSPDMTGEDLFLWWMQDPRFYGQIEWESWRNEELPGEDFGDTSYQ